MPLLQIQNFIIILQDLNSSQTSDTDNVSNPFSSVPKPLQPQEESIEEVIKDTESLFKSREKEYQETIDQIEVSHDLPVFAAEPLFNKKLFTKFLCEARCHGKQC